ncbi:tetratricopeptide repeat protein [Emcibacter nanhaiensis]|uniref:Tetratricopeptide repeat protein n=1 Tax=Emcibacter nanhaiensis TaxID=1505037 RepID=A0A501PRW8_9PROT|nr:tetratricopeptide repeat protein [Emcibacter nanhaiensis]TPD62812.1 tetratricopeptide repeat protein [Emcibacter nanhaiensis]
MQSSSSISKQAAAQSRKLFQKGQSLYQKQAYARAVEVLESAKSLGLASSELSLLLSDCYMKLGQLQKGTDILLQAASRDENNPKICQTAGHACLRLGLDDLAVKFFARNLQLSPGDPKAYYHYANALQQAVRIDEAIELLQEIIPIYPDQDYLWDSLGNSVALRDGPDKALVFFEEALKLNPDNGTIYNNITQAYESVGDYEQALNHARKAVKLLPNSPEAHMNLATSLLISGHLAEGWQEYEWRKNLQKPGARRMPDHIPAWQGEDLAGKTLLIGGEQGVGDEIFLCGLYYGLIDQADKLYIGCDERLLPLYKACFKNAEVVAYKDSKDRKTGQFIRHYPDLKNTEIDYFCLNFDLFKIFWQKKEDLDRHKARRLEIPADITSDWQARLGELPSQKNVGFSWRSGKITVSRSLQYAPLSEWAELIKQTPNTNFINLQYGECREELEELEKLSGQRIYSFPELDLKDDFLNSAALMSCLDLVVGPATTCNTLAVNTGVETWWLYSGDPWWLMGTNNPPWLENGHVFSKNMNEKWSDFMGKISDRLRRHL